MLPVSIVKALYFPTMPVNALRICIYPKLLVEHESYIQIYIHTYRKLYEYAKARLQEAAIETKNFYDKFQEILQVISLVSLKK